jgi:hypothetical protein
MKKLYIMTYSIKPNFNSANFHKYIEDMGAKGWFSDWWHYINNVYIVASTKTASELYNAAIKGMTGIDNVYIVEINPKNEQGWLPKKAWEWLQKYQ